MEGIVIKVLAVIFGGKSTEHEISIETAINYSEWINYSNYKLCPIYINNTGEWKVGRILSSPLNREYIYELNLKKGDSMIDILGKYKDSFYIAIPLLHGLNGEDGTIQGFLEMLNIPYTGNNILTSSLGIDKVRMKVFLKGSGIVEQLPFISINYDDWNLNNIEFLHQVESELGYPLIIKPNRLGSSIGISIANSRSELIQAVKNAFKYDNELVIERFIKNREVNVAVLGSYKEKYISEPIEVNHNSDFYDYKSKYLVDKSSIFIKDTLSEKLKDNLKKQSSKVYDLLRGVGPMRLDFFIDMEDNIYLNEINTLPSMGDGSAYQYLLDTLGISNEEMVEIMVETGIIEYFNKSKRIYKYIK